jgi:hypothetical protein
MGCDGTDDEEIAEDAAQPPIYGSVDGISVHAVANLVVGQSHRNPRLLNNSITCARND